MVVRVFLAVLHGATMKLRRGHVQFCGPSLVFVMNCRHSEGLTPFDNPARDRPNSCVETIGLSRAAIPGMKQDKTYPSIHHRDQAGLGPGSAGQSGDTQGLSDIDEADSESIVELLEEGQYFEAEAIAGIEKAGDAEPKELRSKRVPKETDPSRHGNM